MARKALILGTTGTGKSASIESLDPKETFIINVNNKSLPFKSHRKNYLEFSSDNLTGNYFVSDNAKVILQMIDYINTKMLHVKNVILDDFTYTLTNEYMRRCKEVGYGVFKDVGQNTFLLLKALDNMREDICVFVMGHPEVSIDAAGNKALQMKNLGKMIDQYIVIEGMFTVVLYTAVERSNEGIKYCFTTQNSGFDSAKSPKGMFDDYKIPNDLQYVKEKMIEYEN